MSERSSSQAQTLPNSLPKSPEDAGYNPDAEVIIEDRGEDYSHDPNARYAYRYNQADEHLEANRAWSQEAQDVDEEQDSTNPEEANAQETLSHVGELSEEASEKATFRIRALNRMDRIQSTATLQTLRQYGQDARTARLERKLVSVKPGSRRANRLQYKLNVSRYRGNLIEAEREKVFGRMYERSKGYSDVGKKVAAVEKKRNEFIVGRKIAIEKKRRRKIKIQYLNEMKKADPSTKDKLRYEMFSDKQRRDRLRKEILSWSKKQGGLNMDLFEEKLRKEVQEKYNRRVGSLRPSTPSSSAEARTTPSTSAPEVDEVVDSRAKEVDNSHEAEPLVLEVASLTEKREGRADDDPNQDTVLIDEENGLFGVFDGMGGQGGNPAAASKAAADSVKESLQDLQAGNIDELNQAMIAALEKASTDVKKNGENGSTVATFIKLINVEGKNYMGVAHAGDTRMFIYSKRTNTFRSITTDQSRGNTVYNGLPRGENSDSNEYHLIEVSPDDRIMICSDGITGDFQDQFLSDDEFKQAFGEQSPQACAEAFRRASKKNDDKSIVVVDVKGRA